MSEQTFNIRFDGIELIEKQLFNNRIQENEQFSFDTKVQTLVDPAKNLLVAFVSVQIKRTNGSDILASIICAFGYYIAEFELLTDKNEQTKFNIPPGLENMVRGISISSMRGIMFSEFRGTNLHKAILPIIFVDSLVPAEGNVIDLPEKQNT